MLHITAIGFEEQALRGQAEALASQLNLQVDNLAWPRLSVTSNKLVLLFEHFAPLFVDFSPSYWKKRREAGKKQGLIRACAPSKGLRIIDATAGWGRDAAIMASFGAEVLMLERQPIIAALLADGLTRLDEGSVLNKRLSLMCVDAISYLESLIYADYPDLIYIDPMHPLRQKSALVKKDMQALQQLMGPEEDTLALLVLALTRSRRRVVVKWPQRQAPLQRPDWSIQGKTVRFDVYSPRN